MAKKIKESFDLHKNKILFDFIFTEYFASWSVADLNSLKILLENEDDIFDYKNSKIQKLDNYKENIKGYFDEINFWQTDSIKPTYYQILAILFTEIYLDEYFSNKESFIAKIINYTITNKQNYLNLKDLEDSKIKFYIEKWNFNKLVYWMATWSWKTIVMAINYLQYINYNKDIENIVIITPNENITKQHREEFNKFNILSRRMQFREITKLKREWYSKKNKNEEWTFDAITEFWNSKNLILVDEWHKSINEGIQKAIRDDIWLGKDSFTFEYSATFWQAVNNSTTKKTKVFLDEEERREYQKILSTQDEYSVSVIFDYSFKYFTGDLYWKDVVIDNTKEKTKKEMLYHTIKLFLSYVNQSLYYQDKKKELSDYNLENPLITIFWQKVNTQSKVWTNDSDEVNPSEVLDFLHTMWDILTFNEDIIRIIENIISNDDKIKITLSYLKQVSKWNTSIIIGFIKQFVYLLNEHEQENLNTIQVYDIKNWNNELWLKVWNKYFGLIYVWTPKNIVDNIKNDNVVFKPEWDIASSSLYKKINNWELSMIIWSKRFTTWWNNYRVSTMGLLNVWIWEWSTIIQILWRWVRLKWKNYKLKREDSWEILKNIQSLNIIWLNSNYLDNFIENINEEWENPDEYEEITIKSKKQIEDTSKLKVFTKKKDYEFKNEIIVIWEIYWVNNNWNITNLKRYEDGYKIQFNTNIVIDKRRLIQTIDENWKVVYKPEHEISLKIIDNETIINFNILNKVNIFNSLVRYCEKFSNVTFNYGVKTIEDFYKNILEHFIVYLNREKIDDNWKFLINSLEDIIYYEKLIIEIWQKYIDKYVWYIKSSIECFNQELKNFDEIEWFIPEYKIKIKKEQKEDIEKILDEYLNKNTLESEWNSILANSHLHIIDFKRHIYKPLFEDKWSIEISPIWLNEWEKKFISDLKNYVVDNWLDNNEIYLLRNLPKTWIWVFLREWWFYPDFLLWIHDTKSNIQYLTFIDPKGLRQEWVTSAKINFYKDIKILEELFEWKNIILNSFIVSKSSFDWISKQYWWETDKKDLKKELLEKNIVFQEDSDYIKNIFINLVNNKICV